MKYCPNCGKEVNEKQFVCLNCGYKLANDYNYPQANEDNGSIWWGVLGYFVPLAGLIIYLCFKDTKPKSAKMAGKGALISVIIHVILVVLMIVLFFMLAFNHEL